MSEADDGITWCIRCKWRKAIGWENGWRLRMCLHCATHTRDCRGETLDFSADTTELQTEYDEAIGRAIDAARALLGRTK